MTFSILDSVGTEPSLSRQEFYTAEAFKSSEVPYNCQLIGIEHPGELLYKRRSL